MEKLEMQQKHILKLIAKGRDNEGWAIVSNQLFQVLSENMPKELTIFEKTSTGGRARLTENGEKVLYAMTWL